MWLALVHRHRQDLLPIQNYVTTTVLFVVFEMGVVWRYFVYLNNAGHPGISGAFLILVAVVNAARNSLSLFILSVGARVVIVDRGCNGVLMPGRDGTGWMGRLIVSMGFGVVRPSLGAVVLKIRLLAMLHFVFGVLYSLGTVSIPLDSAGYFIAFFVFPLAFSLTAFLMWISESAPRLLAVEAETDMTGASVWSLNTTITDLGARR